jgi:hypothetical protein
MNYQTLKDFCNSLTEEQLKQEVYLAQVDSNAIKVECCHITERDEYFDHCDSLGTLDEIKKENPDDWEDIIEDATLCPKGTVMLVDEG